MKRCLLVVAVLLVWPLLGLGQGQLYQVRLTANFDSGFGGLPPVTLEGSYNFENLPPDWIDGRSAFYDHTIRSALFDLNGSRMSGSRGSMRVDDDLLYSGDTYRDLYFCFIVLNGPLGSDLVIDGAGINFELLGSHPIALNGLSLPTCAADLDGFSAEGRHAVLTFHWAGEDHSYATYAPIQFFAIDPIPEPSSTVLWLIASAAVLVQRRRRNPLLLLGRR